MPSTASRPAHAPAPPPGRRSLFSRIGLGCMLFLLGACRTALPPAAPLEYIRVPEGRREFTRATSGRTFIPWGFNYDHDHQMRLLEDYWETEWETVVADFHEMKQLGANVVRIHLQLARFMDSPEKANQTSLQQLTRLLQLAERTGLYLDLTGLASYRKADTPKWYDAMEESARWRTQAKFWELIAATGADSPSVFCYDLMNEPFVPTQPRAPGDWLAGHLGGFYYVQALTLTPAGRTPPQVARAWVEQMVRAIRQHDQRHLITLGMLPNSGRALVEAVSPHLDFISVHEYPRSGRVEESLGRLKQFDAGKPLLIEELFPLTCTAPELHEFIKRSSPPASGWIGFYWGQTPEELQQIEGLPAAITRAWLQLFQAANPNRNR